MRKTNVPKYWQILKFQNRSSSIFSSVPLLAHAMSRLNATVKLLFACGELLFLFASLFCVLASGIVASGKIPAFAFPLAKKTSILIVLVSGAALVCSCFGCCAVLRQTKRRGCFSGRRMLVSNSLYCLNSSM